MKKFNFQTEDIIRFYVENSNSIYFRRMLKQKAKEASELTLQMNLNSLQILLETVQKELDSRS